MLCLHIRIDLVQLLFYDMVEEQARGKGEERGSEGRVGGGGPVRVLCVAFAVDFAANARSSDESGVRAKKHATKYSTHT